MRHLEQAGSVLLTGLWTPLVVALITTAASVLIALASLRSDDLKRAERLGNVISHMPPSPERNLVSTARDDLAVTWALRQAAPVDRRLRRAAAVLGALGAVALAGAILVGLYVGLGLGRVSDWFFWVYYSVGLVLLLAAAALRRRARKDADAWVAGERARRGLRQPLQAGARSAQGAGGSPRRRTR